MNKGKRFTFIFILLIVILLLFSCELLQINPLGSREDFPYLYVENYGLDHIFVVDLKDNSIVDTLKGFGEITGISSSKNGEKLYVTTVDGYGSYQEGLYCVNLLTQETELIYDQDVKVYIRPDNVPLLISAEKGDSIHQISWIDTLTNDVHEIAELDIHRSYYDYQNIAFDPVSPIMYAWTNMFRLFSFNYLSGDIVKYYESELYPFSMIISKDGKTLYSPRTALDIEADTLLGEYYGSGTLGLIEDESKIYITNTIGDQHVFMMGRTDGVLNIFDTESFELIDSICVLDYARTNAPNPRRILINKSENRAYISNNTEIFVIRLPSNNVIDVIDFGNYNVNVRDLCFGFGK